MSKRTLLISNGGMNDGIEITDEHVAVMSPGGRSALRIAGGDVTLYGEAPALERVLGSLITAIGGSARRLVLVDGSVAIGPAVSLPELLAVGGDLLLQGSETAPRVQFVGGRLLTGAGEINDEGERKKRVPELVASRMTAGAAIAAGLMVLANRATADGIGDSMADQDEPSTAGPGMYL